MSTDCGFYALSDDQLRRLLAGELASAPFLRTELLAAVQGLKGFYQRAAANKGAVLFRIA
jgi:hypothetical protein